MVVSNTTFELPPNSAPRDVKVRFATDNSQILELKWQPPRSPDGRIIGIFIYISNKASVIILIFV